MRKILLTDRERDIIHLVLELLTGGVVLTAALMAPGAAGTLIKGYQQLQRIPVRRKARVLAEMKRSKLIVLNKSSWLTLTKKGRVRLQKYRLEELSVPRPRVWDGCWRLVFFDIPRKPRQLNSARDYFRGILKRLGFEPLQKSVWVHPFPCDEEVAYTTEVYGLQPFVRVAVVKSLTGGEKLRTKFNLW